MLLISDYNTICMASNILSIKNNNIHIINLSSANLNLQSSSLFYVPRSSNETNQYDIEYANFIFNNTQQRIEFLYLIYQLQIGNPVLIAIGSYPGMYEMAESLLKLIQTRYGYNGYIITNDDLENLDIFESRFSVPGLVLFDQEKVELDEIFIENEKRRIINEYR